MLLPIQGCQVPDRTSKRRIECVEGEEKWGVGILLSSRLGGMWELGSAPSGSGTEPRLKIKTILVHFVSYPQDRLC